VPTSPYIEGCASGQRLEQLLRGASAAAVHVRVLPVPSMFPADLGAAAATVPYPLVCAVAPPSVVSAVGVQGPRLGETLVFGGRRLLGRLDPEGGGHGDRLLALLRAGLSPFVGKAGRPQWEDDESEDPFAIIGVDPGASLEEARVAWRRRLAEYHPDRFETAGAKIRRLALHETQRLNAAFEAITRLRRPSVGPREGQAR
jgi:hypothetical protein